ncbi:MAG TPA: AMP-binding protein [Baekduia sp.]|uniref:AMP-binding protein n=1 Tax=Baekduia sp. TaxID=2600305 RepID=UPI002D793B20|nr:AMP-binding protein [Baekduia sp.]HET6507895.1 AMP-binding protein [Baekduia sp.]
MPAFDVTSLHGRRADERYNRLAVGDLLERVTWHTPDREALIGWEGAYGDPAFARVTYARADAIANQVANALLAAGLRRSDRVILYCDNSVEAVLTLIGIAKAGLVAVPVNPLMAPDVLTWAIGHVEARLAIVDTGLYARGAEAFAAAGLEPAVTIPIGEGDAPAGSVRFAEWIAGQPSAEPEVAAPPIHADDVWSLTFTSGTTSMPKAVMTTHMYSYMATHTYTLSYHRGVLRPNQIRALSFLPIVYHCGHHAAVFSAWLGGGTAIVGRRPDAAGIVGAVTRERATALWAGSPILLTAVADAAEADPAAADLSSLTVALYSWATMHPDLVARLRALAGDDLGLVEVFGQTESMSSFRFWADEWPEKVAASRGTVNHVGGPTPVIAARVVDDAMNDLRDRPGVPGEAVYRGPALAAGYYRDEAATRAAFDGGWFHSGDSCRYEPDGQQIMVDRYKDVVKTGGENVSSQRVEGAVLQHPAVARAAVIGVPDPKWGELIAAVVVLADGAALEADELIAFCRQRLAGYETPKLVFTVDALPETVGGKVLKYRLRERFAGAAPPQP